MESLAQKAESMYLEGKWRVQRILTGAEVTFVSRRWSDKAHTWLLEATRRGCPAQGFSRGRGTPKLSNCVTTFQVPVWLCV